tara:strand:+ start:883 stop:1566 length:684 start_codon:yes stop_codon:yes gene_type:complete
MTKVDQGFLINKFKYNENSVIADFYTKQSGKTSGIIFGGTSKKIKGYLQIGNYFHLNLNSKNETRVSSIKAEIIKAYTPIYFNNQKKLYSIISAMSLIKNLTPENENNFDIFNLIQNFFNLLEKNNWLKNYINWELKLLKYLGYDLNLKNIVEKEIVNNKEVFYVKSSKQKKTVPNFLVNENIEKVEYFEILRGFTIVSSYMEKNIFTPNNLKIPIQRMEFENLLNK